MTDTKTEAALEAEIKAVEKEEKKLQKDLQDLNRRVMMVAAALVLVVGGGIAALAYMGVSSKSVYIENSDIEAPQVALASPDKGVLKNLYVVEGQTIAPNTIVAQVGETLVKSTAGGVVIAASKDIGKFVPENTPVVTTIDPTQLHVVGRLAEDKGLSDVQVGQKVTFTVDAFGSKQYVGTVDEVSPTSRTSDVVFSISDKRAVQEFNVKVYFDTSLYPELKNGMSARMWVYKN